MSDHDFLQNNRGRFDGPVHALHALSDADTTRRVRNIGIRIGERKQYHVHRIGSQSNMTMLIAVHVQGPCRPTDSGCPIARKRRTASNWGSGPTTDESPSRGAGCSARIATPEGGGSPIWLHQHADRSATQVSGAVGCWARYMCDKGVINPNDICH